MKRKRLLEAARGFTLLETLLALGLTLTVIVMVLSSFDLGSKTSIVQRDVAELQQSLRGGLREVTRMIRPVGRGGVAGPQAVLVEQNVEGETVLGGETVLPETDVLTLRGVFESPLFHLDSSDEQTLEIHGDTATLIIDSRTRSGLRQPFDSLKALVSKTEGPLSEPLVLVGRTSSAVYAVVELSSVTFGTVTGPQGEVERATLSLNIAPGTGIHTAEYLALSSGGTFPSTLTTALLAGVLEEYRYFVRSDFVVPGDPSSPPSPKLARVRMIPGTSVVHPAEETTVEDIADDIFDLQVAMGIDLDGDGRIEDQDEAGNPLNPTDDEWRYNDPGDPGDLTWLGAPILFLRVTLLGQANRPDRTYVSEAIDVIEDRVYGEGEPQSVQELVARRHRRRMLRGLIDLRNI